MEANKNESKLTLKSLNKKFEDFLKKDKEYKEENEKNISLISGLIKNLVDKIQSVEFNISEISQKLNNTIKDNKLIVENCNNLILKLNNNILFIQKNIDTINNQIINLSDKSNGLENNVKTNIKDSKIINDNINLLTENLNIVKKQVDDYIQEQETKIEDISHKNNTLDTLKNLINDVQFIVDLKEKNKI